MRIYFVAGSNESSTMASDIETVKNNLQAKGLKSTNTLVKLDSYGPVSYTHLDVYKRQSYKFDALHNGEEKKSEKTVPNTKELQ